MVIYEWLHTCIVLLVKENQRKKLMEKNPSITMRDWASGLPGEVICFIAQRLPVPDYLRLPCVCRSWASCLSGNNLLPTPSNHLPWLCIEYARNFRMELSFLSAPSPSRHRYRLPALSAPSPTWIGSRDGWLAMFREYGGIRGIRLINPITGASLDLPEPSSGIRFQKIVVSPLLHYSNNNSTPPSTIITVVALYDCHDHFHSPRRLSFARPGFKSWKDIQLHQLYPALYVVDVVFHQGQFVALSSEGQLIALEMQLDGPNDAPVTRCIVTLDPSPSAAVNHHSYGGIRNYLVSAAPSGDLLRVLEWRSHPHGEYSSDDDEFDATLLHNPGEKFTNLVLKDMTRNFRVMKLSDHVNSGDQYRWVEADDLGDMSLFLDRLHCVALSARDVQGLRRNCIYFAVVDSRAASYTLAFNVCDAGVFDIMTGVTEAYVPKEFLATSRSKVTAPVWFMPSLI